MDQLQTSPLHLSDQRIEVEVFLFSGRSLGTVAGLAAGLAVTSLLAVGGGAVLAGVGWDTGVSGFTP